MKFNILYTIFFVASVLLVASCTTYKPFYAKTERNWEKANNPDTLKLDYTVFLVGDVGKPDLEKQEPTLKLLESQMYRLDTVVSNNGDTLINKVSSPKDAALFMGDNIYETGMPEPDAIDRELKEARITEQLKIVKDFEGKKIFVPGNHDWNHSRPGGLAAVKRQEEFVENYLDSTDTFIPSNGCPGPVEIQMNGNLVIIVLDSEWWLSKFEKSGINDGCSAGSREQILAQIKDILLRNKGKNIVFTQHHPLYSNGKHGGYFTLFDYIFPLTLVRDNLYIPLPVIGSIYPLMRQYGLSRQDISNKTYQYLRSSLLRLLEEQTSAVIATGHEHALMYTKVDNINHVISGAGSKNSALFRGNDALFGHGTKGFGRLNYYTNGQCWLEFWEPEGDGSEGKLVYRKPLYVLPTDKKDIAEEKQIDYKDSVKYVAVGRHYKASGFKERIMGEHYRSVWATPVRIQYLDMTRFAGGLTPLQLGGGKQTTSLRLMGKDSIQYQFRTVDKNPSSLLPTGFESTFAQDLVQDQISSAHPFGAMIIPKMAESLGIYHTDPKLVYMPYSRLLGPYISEVGGKIGIIEVRPDENLSMFKNFGRTKNAVGTEKLYEKLQEDNDNEVDQEAFLKARLFDMLIGDWDRHEDQWRWAEFEKDKGAIYRPIPRDRDQAFPKYDGFLPGIMKSFVPDLVTFGYQIEDLEKLNIAARNLDRHFLNELIEEDFSKVAQEIIRELPDQVIDEAVKQMPPEAHALSGAEIAAKLKSRRDQLEKVATDYYQILAKEVMISGSDKYEYVKIRKEHDSTRVEMYKTKKDGKIDTLIYQRNFYNRLTREINFYLLGENDSLEIDGDADAFIKIRVVGGDAKDKIADRSTGGKTVIYDTHDNDISGTGSTRIVRSEKSWINEYVKDGFRYDKSGFGPAVDYFNGLDGPAFGISHSIKRYGFRKTPYAFEQKASVLYAPKNSAWEVKYKSIFHSLFAHKYDLVLDGIFSGPTYNTNFYGIGNSTEKVFDKDYYRVRSRYLAATAYFQYRYSERATFGIGPGIAYMDVMKNNPDNFIGQWPDAFEEADRFFTVKSYADLDFRDKKIQPTTGFRWLTNIDYWKQTNTDKFNTVKLKSSLSAYATPNVVFPATLAMRIGAETNFGDYHFYQASTVGNRNYLRGFRNERFSGRTAYFGNAELRIPVTRIRGYVFAGDFGFIGFYDIAKVNSSLPESRGWHSGYGPGIWVNAFDSFLVTVGYGFSKEDKVFNFKTGFRF